LVIHTLKMIFSEAIGKKTSQFGLLKKLFFYIISLIIFPCPYRVGGLFFNDDLDFLDGVVARFWEGAGHGLGCAVGVYCPAANVVFT
jgi:hypothetical protein